MIKERVLLLKLVNLMDITINPDLEALQILAQQAEALLDENHAVSMEVDPVTIESIRGHLSDIVTPVVPYDENHVNMCVSVIQNNKEAAQCAWADLEMIIN